MQAKRIRFRKIDTENDMRRETEPIIEKSHEEPFPPTDNAMDSHLQEQWDIETIVDAPKKKPFLRRKKKTKTAKSANPPKQKDKNAKKERRGPLSFFRPKPKAPEVSPLESGATTVPDLLAPSSVDFFHRDFIVVDGIYHAYLYITGYGYTTKVNNGWLNELVEAGEGVNLNFFLTRQSKDRILSKIANSTMIGRSRMRDVGDTRQDYEELDSAISAGVYMKDEINRNSEDFYYMNTLIEIAAEDENLLEQRISSVETLCTAQDMACRRCDYKQEQAFLSSLPLLSLDADLDRKSRRNALTTGVAAAFPFSSFELCDQSGILLGINLHNRSVCALDIFDNSKYSNANMCVMGMSGAGKTFLLQLIALRLRQQRVKVMIIAPVKGFEFRPACEAIGGNYIKLSPSSDDCINWLEIRRRSLDIDAVLGRDRGDSLVADKIAKTHILFTLLKPDISMQEKNLLDDALGECYARFGITHQNDSLFDSESGDFRPMPTMKDLHDILLENPETRGLALALTRYVKWLGGQTNVDLSNDYTVFDISELGKDMLPVGEMIVTDYCRDECMADRIRKKAVILDELWAIIGASSSPDAAEYVLELFKTIRGLGGSCIGATQDLFDFFALENGKFGKGIINNSRIKVILPMEEEEAMRVKDVMGLSDEETMQIIRNKRGEGLLCAGHNRISVSFQSTQLEYSCITTSRQDLEKMMR